ncbi:1,6-anhydro-N-acetylmuramyl-L-alanine amidase AmpD [Vibrio sp.]|uniref:1,6-anhydro-N-acetylmuramyl-L-alanine amidase AmpD n=1 Tax=Vibrio viridaestus TaxID=2487322 RepID=A0A3N9TIR9_9VIBR|nr:1,6-anhydro-N-acetylmuramyl-L-alanine amidase AmpD [Vibrio viridaestus]MDC0610687.1 1,6-anhydro-N-acetylmuramyl-L-alanine amidase AmpD [Vibrio sp.]RQW63814.1 1,6-anhydro-N-acetylmuramyl-L-alanine amidase AmpD [Vibrio viridaestus]
MIDKDGWYVQARKVASPHFDQREAQNDISLLVVHNISLPPGQFGGPYIEQLFTGKLNPDEHSFFARIAPFRVSAHCLIRRDGEIVQFVSFQHRAWHAGVSSFAGRSKCNDYSIGIELEGSEWISYTDAQYQSLLNLTQAIQHRYPSITDDRITGHQYIAPLRKSDPGLTFDWAKYRSMLKSST